MRAAAGPYDMATGIDEIRDETDDGFCRLVVDVPEHAAQKEHINRNDVREGTHRAGVLAADLDMCQPVIVGSSPRASCEFWVVLHQYRPPDPPGKVRHDTRHVAAVAAAEAEDRPRRTGDVESGAEILLHYGKTAGKRAAGTVVVRVPLHPARHQASVASTEDRTVTSGNSYSRRQ